MYATSEDAMQANEWLTFSQAKAELQRHGIQFCEPPHPYDGPNPSSGVSGNRIEFWTDTEGLPVKRVSLELRTRPILEWLGY